MDFLTYTTITFKIPSLAGKKDASPFLCCFIVVVVVGKDIMVVVVIVVAAVWMHKNHN